MKIVLVNAVQSPYLTMRLRHLALNHDLKIVLLLERSEFKNRPGWQPVAIPGIVIEVLRSFILTPVRRFKDLNYEIKYNRPIPWSLPFAIRRHRPDVVVVCSATQLMLTLFARWLLDFKIILNVEDTVHSTRNHGLFSKIAKKSMYRCADYFLAYSKASVDFLETLQIRDNVLRTSWSVDLNWAKPNEEIRKNFRQKYGIENKVVFLFSGALIPGKGIIPLLKAWSKLSHYERSISTLLIAGTGSQEVEAKAYVKNFSLQEVIFLGQLTYELMRDTFLGVNIFILPTFQDLYSLVVLEAMASGCPVLTTPYNGASELITPGETGWLFDVADDESIENAIKLAIQNKEALDEMGANARQRVLQMDNSIVMSKWADTVRSFL